SVLEEMEIFFNSGECKIERPQTENGKDIRRIHDKRIVRDGKNRRNGIHGKDQVGSLDYNDYQQQGRRPRAALVLNKELVAFEIKRQRDDHARENEQWILLRLDFRVSTGQHAKSRENQKTTKDIDQPMTAVDQLDAGEDKQNPHHQRTQDAPEQHLVLVFVRHLEVREDHDDDKYVVNAQRLLDQITREIFNRLFLPEVIVDENVESHGQRNPYECPRKRLLHGDMVGLSMEYAQVQGQHAQNKQIKACPKNYRLVHLRKIVILQARL